MTTALDQTPHGTAIVDRGVLQTTEVIARVLRIQEIMKALMREGTHFGTIPGTPKPTLYKPGAEMLLMTFRIAASPSNIEDLSTPDEVRYRITMRGTNQVSGEIVGEMIGECSSSEVKYRWQKPVCDEEWQETDPSMRREKWFKGTPPYKQKQIRSSPADVANTILKMATKRALVALTLTSLGASDIFAQDLEDLTDELRESIATEDAPKAEVKQPQRRSTTGTAAPAAAKPIPTGAKFVVGVIGKTYGQKKPFAVYIGEQKFTTFDEALWADISAFVGTTHRVKLAYTETTKDGRVYLNAAGISIADAEPARQAAPEPQPAAADPRAYSPFDRETGEEG